MIGAWLGVCPLTLGIHVRAPICSILNGEVGELFVDGDQEGELCHH